MKRIAWLGTWFLAGAALLAGCGGGGSSEPRTRTPLPELVQDTNPGGDRLDLRERNYFPANAGDTWVFDRTVGSLSTPGDLTRRVQSVSGDEAVFTENDAGTVSTLTYRRTADGILSLTPFAGSVPPAVDRIVGNLLEYPEPFYAVGATRRMLRQGSWGADLDGDGVNESFRLDISQVLVGLETYALPLGSAEAAHFRTVTTLLLVPSKLSESEVAVTATEETWWAPGIGMVRAERSAVDSDGSVVVPAHTLTIASGTVAGEVLFQPQPDGAVQKIALVHNAVAYDSTRRLYWASVPGSVVGQGNRIAAIDATTGAVTYSSPVGSEPFALALASDGSVIYVGLNGSGEIVKLRLPDLVELGRTRLPAATFGGQLFAESLAVSPADSDVVAVAMAQSGSSPRHAGVALLRAGVLQPNTTQGHTGSNLIVFDPNGQFIYGYNAETTEFGLRRIAVLADGVTEVAVVSTNGDFSVRNQLIWSAQGIVLGTSVYRPSDLALLGRVGAAGGGCRPLATANRIACFDDFGQAPPLRLVVADATTFSALARPVYSQAWVASPPSMFVAGPPGQVLLRFGNLYWNQAASELWLFTSELLQ